MTTSEATSTLRITTTRTTSSTMITVSNVTEVTTTSISTTTVPYNPNNCNRTDEVKLPNGTCVPNTDGQIIAVNILSNSTNPTEKAEALILYFSSITHLNGASNASNILTLNNVDTYLSELNNVNLTISSKSSFIMVQQPKQDNNVTSLGALFAHNIGGGVISTINLSSRNNQSLSAAATISDTLLDGVTSLNMLIIDTPSSYVNIDNSNKKRLASSIIMAVVHKNSSVLKPMNISLSFKVLDDFKPNLSGTYLCSFYDTYTSAWNESGCTMPYKDLDFGRYECSCNHLTSFALIWLPVNAEDCNNETHAMFGDTCRSKADVQKETADFLRGNSTNSTVVANALSDYITSITNTNITPNSTYVLTVNEIDNSLNKISNVNVTLNRNDSILIAQQPKQDENIIVLGASFTRNIGGEVVKSSNKDNVTRSYLSAAAIISNESLSDVTSLNMLIIDKPTSFENIDNSSNKTLASSIILALVQRNSSTNSSMNISLYFQVLPEYKPNISATYLCSFYDTNNFTWNEFGCTTPYLNKEFNRYECSCGHLTSFALIWLPKTTTPYLNSQDIASLVFQSISIICFIIIITHAAIRQIRTSTERLNTYYLLPLISGASTTILFIFYIALAMTVYTQTSQNETECFLSSSILMFFVYFFLIFMFCTKTSIGYFNYLRFVRLFPEPSLRKLFIMILISFFISITCVALAIGFNSNSSFSIIELYSYKLCWFSRDVIYYFLTIPACLFLVINIIIFILVGIRTITHYLYSTSPHPLHKRMKRCVIILLLSCITQGIGWLFGPFITIVNEEAGNILGWFFVIFNGLEGLWSILLYIIIRSQGIDESQRVRDARESIKLERSMLYEDNRWFMEDIGKEDKYRNREKESSQSHIEDLDVIPINWSSDDNIIKSYF